MQEMQPDLYGGPAVPAELTPPIRPPDLTPPPTWAPPVKALILRAAALTGFTVAQINGASRKQDIVRVRVAITMAATRKGLTPPMVARVMGDRHDSTIHWQATRGRKLMETDAEFVALVERIGA